MRNLKVVGNLLMCNLISNMAAMRFRKLFLLLFLSFPFVLLAQSSGSLQRVTLTSVTLVMDSVKTAADAELVRTKITQHTQVKDFDIKMKNCDFTIDNSNNTLDIIFSDLAQIGQPGRIYAIRENQTFTHVPVENCISGSKQYPDKSEQDVIKEGGKPKETGAKPKEVGSQPKENK